MTAREPTGAPLAAYTLLLFTVASIGAAFWLALSEGGAAIIRPTVTAVVAGLAGGLLCVSTRDIRQFQEEQWIRTIYSWLRTAFAGAATSLGVFLLASLAFPESGAGRFQYTGLALLGGITGYFGASVAMSGALRWGPSPDSPLDMVSRQVDLHMDRILPSLQPHVSRLLEEVILGPPIPPYDGYVGVKSTRHEDIGQDGRVDFAVWFDTVRPDADSTSRIVIRGRRTGSEAPENEHTSIPIDVLLHVPTASESPLQRTINVPLNGASEPISFSLAKAELKDGAIPADTLLELRCRGALIRVIDLQKMA